MKYLAILLFTNMLCVSCARHEAPVLGDEGRTHAIKTYSNPIIPGGMADPHVIRHEGHYYLYATSHQRGYDVFVSDDLLHWENKGLAFDDPRGGAWAPDVFYNSRDKTFHLYYTDNDPNKKPGPTAKQIGVAVADSPLGPFVDRGSLVTSAIDAHLFQDDDGRMFLYYVAFDHGNHILVQPMADAVTKDKIAPHSVISPTDEWERLSGHVTEAPFMLKRNDVYYLMYSGCGADHLGYGIAYATSNSPLGPFTKFGGNPIGKYDASVFGPGHHSVVEGPDGKMWMIYHQKYDRELSYRRFLALDPIWFDEAGVIHVRLSRGTPQPAY